MKMKTKQSDWINIQYFSVTLLFFYLKKERGMKFSKIIVFSIFSLLFMNFQCDDEDDVQLRICDVAVVLDNSIYEIIESDFYSLTISEIEGDCLNVNISASGCDGSTWVLTLVDSEGIAVSRPPQRYLKLALANNEVCLAVFNKEQSSDLTELKITGVNELLLNIEDFSGSMLYTY
jgi:hypothetical protein